MRVGGGTLGCRDFQRCIKIKFSKQGENNIELSSRPGVAQVLGEPGGAGIYDGVLRNCIRTLKVNLVREKSKKTNQNDRNQIKLLKNKHEEGGGAP